MLLRFFHGPFRGSLASLRGRRLGRRMMLGWTAPARHRCARMRSLQISSKGDCPWIKLFELASTCQSTSSTLHGVNAAEEPVLRKKLRRKEMVALLEKLSPTVVAIEAALARKLVVALWKYVTSGVVIEAPERRPA